MFCRFCGSELPENANFCTKCGKIIDDAGLAQAPATLEDLIGDPAARAQEDPFKNEKDELGGDILKYGIMSLAFGCTGILSLLGLIFACIGKSKVGKYLAKFQETQGKSTVGKHLCTAGLWASIGMAIYFTLIFIIALISGLADGGSSNTVTW
ncbi:MAG: zinc ribbon domain-containing protein [Clostridia bacterium]|nr:zinc ribbon domain-containing protein [Clostridia bacterium]